MHIHLSHKHKDTMKNAGRIRKVKTYYLDKETRTSHNIRNTYDIIKILGSASVRDIWDAADPGVFRKKHDVDQAVSALYCADEPLLSRKISNGVNVYSVTRKLPERFVQTYRGSPRAMNSVKPSKPKPQVTITKEPPAKVSPFDQCLDAITVLNEDQLENILLLVKFALRVKRAKHK